MADGFRIPKYLTRSARLVLDSLNAPVNMLWLHAQTIDDITGKPNLVAARLDELPGHHFLYRIGIQPQVELVEGQRRWNPSFELDFSTSDFLTLHALLLRFKEHHQLYLDRTVTEASTTTLTEVSGGLCFELDYSLNKSADPEKGDRLIPACQVLRVFHLASGEHTNIGTFRLFGPVTGMTGLLLEAERINAILNGEDAEAVAAIAQMPFTRPVLNTRPVLRVV